MRNRTRRAKPSSLASFAVPGGYEEQGSGEPPRQRRRGFAIVKVDSARPRGSQPPLRDASMRDAHVGHEKAFPRIDCSQVSMVPALGKLKTSCCHEGRKLAGLSGKPEGEWLCGRSKSTEGRSSRR